MSGCDAVFLQSWQMTPTICSFMHSLPMSSQDLNLSEYIWFWYAATKHNWSFRTVLIRRQNCMSGDVYIRGRATPLTSYMIVKWKIHKCIWDDDKLWIEQSYLMELSFGVRWCDNSKQMSGTHVSILSDFWHLTLTFDLRPWPILPMVRLNLHTKYQGVRVLTDRQTDGWTLPSAKLCGR